MADISFDAPYLVDDQTPPLRLRHVAAVTLGNALEFYDFLVYGFFAVYIGRTFFPSHDGVSGLLLSLATFGAGFLTRPIGAIVIGRIGDRSGRKPAMLLSFALMGVAILGLALTPSYARIGMAAPILALLFRLLQGFALGGEVGPSTAFLLEAAPIGREGFYSGMQMVSQNLAQLLAGAVGLVLAGLFDDQALQVWGWRLAMLIGVIIVPFGLMVRRDLPETLHGETKTAAAPETASRPIVSLYSGIVLLCLLMLMSGTIGTYVGAYQTTYALTTLHLPATAAFGVAIVRGLVAVPSAVASGWLADRFGRKPVLVIAGSVLFVSILPAFWLIVDRGGVIVFYVAIGWLTFLASLTGPAIIVTLAESLPRAIRCSGVSIVYAFTIAIFGGSAQFIVAWLTGLTHSPLAPAFYWTGAMAVGLTAAILIKESAPSLRRSR